MFWETLTGEHAFNEIEFFYEIEEAILKGTRPKIPSNTPENVATLIE